jgi:hypothetical protein
MKIPNFKEQSLLFENRLVKSDEIHSSIALWGMIVNFKNHGSKIRL